MEAAIWTGIIRPGGNLDIMTIIFCCIAAFILGVIAGMKMMKNILKKEDIHYAEAICQYEETAKAESLPDFKVVHTFVINDDNHVVYYEPHKKEQCLHT